MKEGMQNRAQLRKFRDFEKLDRIRRDEGLKALVETQNGRFYLWHILGVAKAIGHNAMGASPYETAFNCGMQNVGQQILSHLVEVAPDSYLLMIKENADEQRERNAILERAGGGGEPRDSDDSGDAFYT